MEKWDKISGIILAGGKSSRMGSNKALINYRGKPLISYSIDLLSKFCDEIVISTNEKLHDFKEFKQVPDEIPGVGPIGGLYSCLHHVNGNTALVLSCDLPNVSNDLIDYLIDSYMGQEVLVPSLDGKNLEPLCAMYQVSLKDKLKEIVLGQRIYKMHDIINKLEHKTLLIHPQLSFYTPSLFLNINSKKDLNSF